MSSRRRLVAGGAVLAVVAGGGVTVAHTTGTWASYTDKAKGNTGAFTSATLPPPTALTCTVGLLGILDAISWTAPATPPPFDSYLVSWTRGAASGTASVPAGTTVWRPVGLAAGTYTVQVRTVRGSWSSALSGSGTISTSYLVVQLYAC